MSKELNDFKETLNALKSIKGFDTEELEILENLDQTMDEVMKEITAQNKIQVKFINYSNNPDPEYSSDQNSGFDLRADIGNVIQTLRPLERKLIKTGLYFELPPNYEIQVRPRSGLAIKNGITVLNTPGTVDSNYRGELMVILINLSNENFYINTGDRIAQAVVAPVTCKPMVNLLRTERLNETERGEKGFGSSGVK